MAGYRNRREDELLVLAQRTAKEVLATKRSHTLAPMNPYERLIVHTAISEFEGLVSESIGADTERRVVIKSTAPDATQGDDWRPQRKDSGRRNSRDGGRGARDNRSGRNDHSRGGRGGSGGHGQGRPYGDKKSSTPEREYANRETEPSGQPVVPERREAVKDGDGLPLYGKIEL